MAQKNLIVLSLWTVDSYLFGVIIKTLIRKINVIQTKPTI